MRTPAAILTLICSTAFAAEVRVQYNFADFTSTPQTLKRIYITPVSSPLVESTNIISGDRRTFTNDSSGVLIVTNVVTPASYEIDFVGSYMTLTFTNTFPSTNDGVLLNAKDWISAGTNLPSGSVAYSMASADARFAPLFSGLTTNVNFIRPGPLTNTMQFSNGVLTNITAP